MNLLKLQHMMVFINIIWNAMLRDPIAKMMAPMLTRLHNPPTAPLQIVSPGVRHSITMYLALEHASHNAYELVMKSTCNNFGRANGVDECLPFAAVEDLIATHTGIKPIEHHMYVNLCVPFTGPFEELERCPTCDTSHWNESKLTASHGCLKIPVKTFITLPLGLQLQALYCNPESAHAMLYLQTQAQAIINKYIRSQNIPLIDDIVAGWDFLSAYLDSDI